jgi:hypothetical protein
VPGPYRLFVADGPSAPAGDSTSYTLGVEFYVTAGGLYLYGFRWWCAPGADASPKPFQLFECVTDIVGTPVDGAEVTSSALTAGAWNYAPLPDPVLLTAGQHYRAGVLGGGSGNWYSAVAAAFTGDVVDGPLVAPSTANALGGLQGSFVTSTVMAYPRFVGNGANYGIDVTVSEAPVSAETGSARAGVSTGPGSRAGATVVPSASAGAVMTARARGGAG